MRLLFKSMETKKADGWMLGFYGNSCSDGKDYCLDTHCLHADEVPDALTDSKTTSQMIAGLLNAYYKKIEVTKLTEEEVCRMGIYIPDEDVPVFNPNQIVLPF